MTSRLVAAVALAAALVSCADSRTIDATSTGSGTGVRGRAVIGPMCPVMRDDQPCPDRPVETTLEIVARASGAVVATVETDDEGRFAADLSPGDYLVRLDANAPPPGNLPQSAEADFTVVAGSYTDVTLTFDSGIR